MKKLEILTVQEVADILKVDLETVYRMIERKELPVYRVGRVWRVKAEDVEKVCDKSDS